MRKLATLILAAGLMLGTVTESSAIDIKLSGQYDFTFQWSNENLNKQVPGGGYNGNGSSSAFYQRIRPQIDIIASESLKGVMLFEIGDTSWGRSISATGRGAGGGIGADGVSIEVKRAYIDWIIPQTDTMIRMGIQGFANPSFAGGNQIFNDDVAGISSSISLSDNVGLSTWWFRPLSGNTNANANGYHHNTNMDMFGMALPLSFDGVKVTPWGMYVNIGRDSLSGYDGSTSSTQFSALLPRWVGADNMPLASKQNASAWWAGLTGEVTAWNPFRLAWDFNYGSVDFGKETIARSLDLKRSGWILSAIAEYKLDFGTPGMFFWYGSGDDNNIANGSEMMPSIAASSQFTSFGQDDAGFNTANTSLLTSVAGTWGLGLQIKDISFVEGLMHTARVAYIRGTNSNSQIREGVALGLPLNPWLNGAADGGSAFTYMTTKDSAWEFNFDSSYEIYKNLTLGVELGYIKTDFSEGTWGKGTADNIDDLYKIGIGMMYKF